jgi:hypothetical protein
MRRRAGDVAPRVRIAQGAARKGLRGPAAVRLIRGAWA